MLRPDRTEGVMAKILVLHWNNSDYDSLRGFLRCIAVEFRALGHRIDEFLLPRPSWNEALAVALQKGGYDFALGMSGIGTDISARVEGKSLSVWEAAKVPFFDWCCDHPYLFPSRHALRSRYVLHGYVFPDHARYQMAHLDPSGVAFLAYLGIPTRRLFAGAPLPLAARNGRILFAKTGGDTKAIEARWKAMGAAVRGTMFDAAEDLLHGTTNDFLPTVQRAGERHGLMLGGSGALTLRILRELDVYTRYRRARIVVEAVRPYPVDIIGKGWEHVDVTGAKAQLLGPGAWADVMRMLPGYLGSLSTHPLIDESVHDRVFFGLASGTVPISESNGFSRKRLPELECYAFRFHPDQIAAAVERLLADPAEGLARTERTYEALLPEFSLTQTARRILEFVTLREENYRLA